MDKAKNFNLGYACILLCCCATAVSLVFISHMNKTHNTMLSIFMTFTYAILIFNVINFNKIRYIYTLVFQNKKTLLRMNVITLLNWLGTFMALRYLDPATTLSLILGILSVTIFLISTPIHKFKSNKHLCFSVLLVLFSMGLVIKQNIALNPGEAHLHNMLHGLAWCALDGITGAFIGTSSEAMGKVGFSVTQILATRFYFLAIFGGVVFLFTNHAPIVAIDWKYYLLSSVVVVFFPLLMYQTAIRELGTLLVSLIEPFSPVLAYILQVIVGDYHFNIIMITLLLLSCMAIIWFVRIEQKIQGKKHFIAIGET